MSHLGFPATVDIVGVGSYTQGVQEQVRDGKHWEWSEERLEVPVGK
jgi:hypothetical protein